jgi:hypothetical protein
MEQLRLFEDEAFVKYHAENPQVYQAFKKLTIQTIQKGFRHYSAKGIYELIRWHTGTAGNDGFKVSNNYTPFYARLFEKDYPQYRGYFRKRKSKFD